MFEKLKPLLVGIFIIALCGKVAVGQKLLDVGSDVFGDLYNGCRKEAMEKFINSGLIQKELDNSEEFQKAWGKIPQCSTLINEGIKEHTSALSVFLDGDKDFLKKLEKDVEALGENFTTYEHNFHFKSLHFLLMDAMKLLKPTKCETLYGFYEQKEKPKTGSAVKFSSFAVVNSKLTDLVDVAGEVVLKIESCFFVNLGKHTCKRDTSSVLISPAEVFTVKEVVKQKDEDDEVYTEIVLKHANLTSTPNCYMFSRSASSQSNRATSAFSLSPLFVIIIFLVLTS